MEIGGTAFAAFASGVVRPRQNGLDSVQRVLREQMKIESTHPSRELFIAIIAVAGLIGHPKWFEMVLPLLTSDHEAKGVECF